MDFGFSPEQEALRQEVVQFIKENVTPELLAEAGGEDEGGASPMMKELRRKVAERGWVGISWPKEYGGQAGSRIDQYIIEEEFARVGIGVGGAGSGAPAILAAGSLTQRLI